MYMDRHIKLGRVDFTIADPGAIGSPKSEAIIPSIFIGTYSLCQDTKNSHAPLGQIFVLCSKPDNCDIKAHYYNYSSTLATNNHAGACFLRDKEDIG